MGKFYITSAIPYVNSIPHIGHALEFIQTDVIARYQREWGGEDVLKLSGGDENALKNVQAAEKAGVEIQEFVDRNNNLFQELTIKLNAAFDVWQKGSDQEHHYPSSQELWRRCDKNDDIYKESYKGLYCVGCEAFYAPDELNENGECYEHPGKKLEEVEEKNYFFRLSKYQDKLIELIQNDELEIYPSNRKHEVLSFLVLGLKDISISRSNERAKNWGVPVPGDSSQRAYVWFDALNIYQSGVGFGWNEEMYQKWWPADLHVIGKGILRFHAVYWPAFLLSAGLKLPKKIFVHEYFTVDGQKMSKTVGNVYDPVPLLEEIGADPFRYYCLAKISPFTDGDFSEEKLLTAYTSDLANGIGNLVSRVSTMAEQVSLMVPPAKLEHDLSVGTAISLFQFDKALKIIWDKIKNADTLINERVVWKLEGKEKEKVLTDLVNRLRQIGTDLAPFLPETSEKILKIFAGPDIKKSEILFPRLV